jgi:hypothetical protein
MVYGLIAAIAILVAIYLLVRSRRGAVRIGEILPSKKMQEKYGLYAENRPEITIDPDEVPASLRDLIPMAEK